MLLLMSTRPCSGNQRWLAKQRESNQFNKADTLERPSLWDRRAVLLVVIISLAYHTQRMALICIFQLLPFLIFLKEKTIKTFLRNVFMSMMK